MAGIDIGIGANTNDFERGVKQGVVKPLEGVEDVLKDVEKAGDKAGEQLEDAFKDAQKDTEKFEQKHKDLADTIKKTGRAGKDSGDDFKQGTNKAKEGLDEVGREAESTAKEAAASFDGSAESIGDAFQEVAANAFAGFGPAGLIAGAAIAAGLGVVFSKMQEGAENSERFKEKVSELAQELIDIEGTGGPSLDYIVDRLKDLATETDDAETSLKDLYDISQKANDSFKDLAQAYAGNTEGLEESIKASEDKVKALEEEQLALDMTTDSGNKRNKAIAEELSGQEKYIAFLNEGKKAAEAAAEQERFYIESGAAAMDARAEAQETLQSQLQESIGLWDELKDAEGNAISSASDPGAYVAAMQARNDAATNFYNQVITFSDNYKLSAAETQELLEQGPDFGPTLSAIESSGMGQSYANEVKRGVSGAEQAVKDGDYTAEGEVKLKAETGKAEAEIDKVADQKREADIKVTTSNKANAIDEIKKVAKDYTANVKVNVQTGDAAEALSNFISKKRTINITVNATDANGKKVY